MSFYTDKQKRVRPISKRRMHIGTRQTGVAHLAVPRRISGKSIVTTRKLNTPEDVLKFYNEYEKKGYTVYSRYDNSTGYYVVTAKINVTSNPKLLRAMSHDKSLDAKTRGKFEKQAAKIEMEHKAEVAMVQDEAEGEAKYLQMAETADKEGRHSEAQVFRQHAQDEARHRAEDSAIVKKSYRMQRLDEIKYELAETSNKEKLVKLRREAHDIWFNEHNYGTSKENDKEARKVYDSINAKLDSKLENEHKSGLEWEKNFFKSR